MGPLLARLVYSASRPSVVRHGTKVFRASNLSGPSPPRYGQGRDVGPDPEKKTGHHSTLTDLRAYLPRGDKPLTL